MSATLVPGSRAPAFEAEGSDGRRYALGKLLARGPVLLVFYPMNNTSG